MKKITRVSFFLNYLPTIIFKNGDKWEDLSFDNAMKKFRNSFKVEINKIETKYGLYFRKEIPDKY